MSHIGCKNHAFSVCNTVTRQIIFSMPIRAVFFKEENASFKDFKVTNPDDGG
jgi:hypothetical protein